MESSGATETRVDVERDLPTGANTSSVFFLCFFVPVSFVPDGYNCIARYDYLVIETSGVSDPESIVRALDKTFGKLTRARCAAPACSSVSTAVLSRSCTQQPAVTCVSSVLIQTPSRLRGSTALCTALEYVCRWASGSVVAKGQPLS